MSDCPREIIDEILSCIHSERHGRLNLQDLRAGLTCKAWYQAFHSTIIGVQIERLVEATENSTLQFHRLDPAAYSEANSMLHFKSKDFDSDWCSSSTPIGLMSCRALIHDLFYSTNDPDFDYSIVYQVYKNVLSSAEQIWSLNSLLSRSRRCRRVQISFFHSELWSLSGELVGASRRLMEACARQQGIEMTITNVSDHYREWPWSGTNEQLFHLCAPRTYPPTKRSLLRRCRLPWGFSTKLARLNCFGNPSNIPGPHEPNCRNDCVETIENRLSMLILSNAAPFIPTFIPSLHNIAIHSSATVTRLHFSNCRLVPDDWNALLSSWRFERLSHFSIRDVEVPFPSLISFLRVHPTLAIATLLVEEFAAPAQVLAKDDFLPNVRQLVAAPSLLVPILSSISNSKSRGIGKLLPTLETLTISQDFDCFTRLRKAQFNDISKVLSLIASHHACSQKSPKSHIPQLHTLGIRIVDSAKSAFEDWLRHVTHSFTSSTTSQSSNLESIANLSLRGIVQFHISVCNPWDSNYGSVPMGIDPALVVDAISLLFRGSTDLKKVVLKHIFTISPSVNFGPLWENCATLAEVELPGMAKSGMEEVWRRPTSTLE